MNDENRQGPERQVPPDPFPEIDDFILSLTPEQLQDTSIEDARTEENFRFAASLGGQ